MDDLKSLAERSRQLSRGIGFDNQSGSAVHRDLSQLYEDAVRLASAVPGGGGGAAAPPPMTIAPGVEAPVPVPADVLNRAQRLLLSTGGYDVETAAREAQQLQIKLRREGGDLSAGTASGGPTTDVAGFLSRIHKAVLGSAVSDATAAATRHMEALAAAAQNAQWEASKAAMLSALGLGLPAAQQQQQELGAAAAAFGASRRVGDGLASSGRLAASGVGMMTSSSSFAGQQPAAGALSMAGPATGGVPFGYGPGDVTARSQLDLYASQLGQAVTSLLTTAAAAGGQGAPSSGGGIVRTLGGVAEESWSGAEEAAAAESAGGGSAAGSGSDVSQHSRMWRLLLELTREGSHPGVGAGSYARHYNTSAAGSGFGASSALMSRHWAAGGLAYTCALFRHVLETTVTENAGAARVGGQPGLPQLVRGYLNVLLDRHARAAMALAASQPAGPSSSSAVSASSSSTTTPSWYASAVRSAPLVGGHPLWPQVYLCLRCAGWRDALALLQEGHAADVTRVPPALVTSLEAHVVLMEAAEDDSARGPGGEGAPPTLPASGAGDAALGQLTSQASGVPAAVARTGALFAQLRDMAASAAASNPAAVAAAAAAAAVDPWQVGVLSLIAGPAGEPDLQQPLLVRSTQDFCWQRLWHVLTSDLAQALAAQQPQQPSSSSFIPYTLADLGASLLAVGPEHFDQPSSASSAATRSGGSANSRAYAWAEAALLGGLPEVAVAHLAAHGHVEAPGRHLADATHMALALHHYGLLRTLPAQLAGAVGASSQQGQVQVQGMPPAGSGCDVTEVQDMAGLLLHVQPKQLQQQSADVSGGVLALDLPFLVSVYCGRVVRHNPSLAACTLALLADHRSPGSVTGSSPRSLLMSRLVAHTAAYAELAGPLELTSAPAGDGGGDVPMLRSDVSQGTIAGALSGAAALAASSSASGGSSSLSLVTSDVTGILLEAARDLRASGRAGEALQLYLRLAASPSTGASAGVGHACDLLLDGLASVADAPLKQTSSAAAASERSVLIDIASAFLGLQSVQTVAAAAALSSGGGASAAIEAASLSTRLRGLATALHICSLVDALSAGAWSDALAHAEAGGLTPLTPAQAEGGGPASWQRLFDPLPVPVKELYATCVLRGLMRAAVQAWPEARRAAAASTGLPPGKLLAGAMSGAAAGGSAGSAALGQLRALKNRAHALVVGHSPLMRRYVPGALLTDLVAAHMGLQA